MPCTSPLTGYLGIAGGLQFSRRGAEREMQVPCGQCMDCRIARGRAWAIRCVHESQKHLENAFITLTYAPEHLPFGGTLIKKDFQDFMKRLRKSIHPKKISFFHCGEYGENLLRPHYHALLFGHDFQDKLPWKKSHDGSQIYTSKTLETLWGKGFCSIGSVSYQTAAYCSSYILKKINGDRAEHHYRKTLPDGQVVDLLPEYITMSLKPAIGKDWINKYGNEVYPSDSVVMRGKEIKPPRYYDKLLKRTDQELHDQVKKVRSKRTMQDYRNASAPRKKARRIITAAKINLYKRNLE